MAFCENIVNAQARAVDFAGQAVMLPP